MKQVPLALAAAALFAATSIAYAQGGPNDAQIAAIVVTANQVDIDAGKLAQSRSQSKDVKQFAQQMITDHSGVQVGHPAGSEAEGETRAE